MYQLKIWNKFNGLILISISILLYSFADVKSGEFDGYDRVLITPIVIGQYLEDSTSYKCYRYDIINHHSTECLLWIEQNETGKDPLRYFKKRIGDFSLQQIIYEYGSTLIIEDTDNFSELYSTFFKLLSPQGSFSIYVNLPDSMNETQFLRNIKVLPINNSTIFTTELLPTLKKLSYKYDNIIITPK